jgi:beta-glucosidase
MLITENSAAFPDEIQSDGRIHDARRRRSLQTHLAAVARAIDQGVNIQG